MGGVLDIAKDFLMPEFIFGSDDPKDASKEAAQIAANSSLEALEYLKEREVLPQFYREEALKTLGGLYGFNPDIVRNAPDTSGNADLENKKADLQRQLAAAQQGSPIVKRVRVGSSGGQDQAWRMGGARTAKTYTNKVVGYNAPDSAAISSLQNQISGIDREIKIASSATYDVDSGEYGGYGDQQELIDRSMNSPLYQSIMGGQEIGEEAIMRSAGMTGGLRSGNVQGNLYDYNTQLQNQALLSSYNEQLQGLTGLAGLPSNSNQIAQGISDVGAIQSQGITAAAQTDAMRTQNMGNSLLGIGGIIAAMYSDRRLKKNIKQIGEVNGYNFYSFDWNSVANRLGLHGSTCGCMADEVFNRIPKAVFLKDNFMMVNYTMIGVL